VGDTSEVGSYPDGASQYGALDMVGNVFEWVADNYDETYYGSSPDRNPVGPGSGVSRVLRGGSWNPDESYVRLSTRYKISPASGPDPIGFRCAASSQ
jgi:serine/threonine-protein kinase